MTRQPRSRPRTSTSEPPLRAELFSVEQLARHARTLAHGHQLASRRNANNLLTQLDENERTLQAFNRLNRAVLPTRHFTSAAEWMLDNFYLLEEQIQLARRHLPRGYSRELPCLLHGPSAGLPRVYDIVLEMISHVDAQIDDGPLTAFIAAYQSVDSLTLGELWAVPIMLRLGLIENLQRIVARLAVAHDDRDLAELWVNRLQDMEEHNPAHLVVVVADMAQSGISLTSSFVAEFCQLLSHHGPVLHLARSWVEHRLAEQGLSIERMVDLESQGQAADQVSVSHCIASLRFLSATDWKSFVETLSLVDATLRTDPAGYYAKMDFATRDRYRHAVEAMARHSELAEAEVAQMAVQLATDASRTQGSESRTAHVGYYLIDKGQSRLEQMAKPRWPWRTRIGHAIRSFPMAYYVGGVGLVTLLASYCLMLQARMLDTHAWRLVAITGLFVICASQLGVALMNWLSTLLVQPRLLPRLDSSAGIAAEWRTMVVVPTMLTSEGGIDRLVESMEIHYLSNHDEHLHFALLTDFRDARTEHLPDDQDLLNRAHAGVEILNCKYPSDGPQRFFLFHRPRRWNAAEDKWMGYERKRGKLTDFNALLRGGSSGCFSDRVGDMDFLSTIKYVITLDTDTQLPRDAARRLVATMAHPLNRPVFCTRRGVVVEGYGILQPRVGVSLASARRSWFARLFASDAGIDPYTRAVSDVYQDLFGEGSFIGKGIYDVDAFEQTMVGRIPENTVLSHDLLEACHARSALVSDVEFYEAYPCRYDVDMDRRHRWMRGDWQIAQWLLPRVPGWSALGADNPLSRLSHWKLFDNLRRSVVPPATLLFMIGTWMLVAHPAGLGVWWVLAILSATGLLSALVELYCKSRDMPWSSHQRLVGASFARHLGQALLAIVWLPYDGYICCDAIARTLWRVLVSRKHLLEWQTSSDSELCRRADLGGFYATMWIAPVIALACGLWIAVIHPSQLAWMLPILAAWIAAPWLAWWISQPTQTRAVTLTPDQVGFLRGSARKTWYYFESLVNASENWLPPDNFQEVPEPLIASRTSPTNMGLALLANLAARDFGYLAVGGLIQRTQDALATMQRLERYQGHFYNWYDTRTLAPLLPLYVSSVDSGNLSGHLLTLGAGLREEAGSAIFSSEVMAGLRDSVEIVRDFGRESAILTLLDAKLAEPFWGLRAANDGLAGAVNTVTSLVTLLADESSEFKLWTQTLRSNCEAHLVDLRWLAPWVDLPVFSISAAGESFPYPTPANAWIRDLFDKLDQSATLGEVAQYEQSICPLLEMALKNLPDDSFLATKQDRANMNKLLVCVRDGSAHACQRLLTLDGLAKQCDELAAMDFTFLFDQARDLFAIGYNVTERRRDNSFYDLLASEARLCSYVAIALGQVPQEHWFSMGRLLVAARGSPLLASWSGSMFEYLMPLLVMPSYENTLLDHTCKAAVQQQIAYGNLRGVPWGISESGYNRIDAQFNYQYRAFGVPGLGLKRGLGEDLVIAPYASAMALIVSPLAACENLQRLTADGRCGSYGFYEAVDYTGSRLPPDKTSVSIRSFMVHHQGMSLLAFDYLLNEAPMQRRFMACPMLKAADLLLQERVPATAASVVTDDLVPEVGREMDGETESTMRVFTDPTSSVPEVHLLSNGRYHVVVTSAGSGYTRWHDLAVTRWREDATRDHWGTFVYVRDLATGEYFSAAYQPTVRETEGYEAIFTQARAEFRQRKADLEIHTEICVSPEDDVELRRIKLTNRSAEARLIELTSYAEVVLTTADADAAHPAFSNLFVQTEFVQASSALLCSRRARSEDERPPWLLHLMVSQGDEVGGVSCETDRCRFVGRGGNMASPAAMLSQGPLSNTVGPVLDPIISLRRTLNLAPHASATIDLVIGVTESRETALAYIEKYQSSRMADRALDLAWTHSQVTLHHLSVPEDEAQLYDRLAGALIYADPLRRANSGVLLSNRRGHTGLWSHGISGDLPIVLLHISDDSKIHIVRQVIRAHSYWRMKGVRVDLVILYEDVSVYRQSLLEQITSLISTGFEAQILDAQGGIFVRRLDHVSNEDRVLLQAVARVVLDDERGSLAEQMDRRREFGPRVPKLIPSRPVIVGLPVPLPHRELVFANGLGGFTRDGHEYIITLKRDEMTPAPWVNVLANATFGTLISESGAAYTWLQNAHEFRLTPWSNDPVLDPTGEAIYIRDEQTGQYWSPTPSPARGVTPYVIRHGFGYTVFEHVENGVASELWVYVAMDAPVKFSVLKLRNVSGHSRRLSVTSYSEWVLGELRQKCLMHVRTELDAKTGALLARNYDNTELPGRIVFVDVNDSTRTVTGDRKEFIGRNGSLAQPAALNRACLSGKVGAGLDPCGAVQVVFDLAIAQERETSFRLGVGRDLADVQSLIHRFRLADACRNALESVWAHWSRTLCAVNVDTPDPAVNVLANGWLLYQTLSCRLWGRTGFYQSGGAYGFRDQLQDVMALVHAEPALTREHLLRAAARQFREGDVQHWWHPPTGRGVRSHSSDDYLWLPYVTCRYVTCLADTGVLDELIPFLDARLVKPEEEAYYDLPNRSEESATLYQHCVRAIEYGLKFGDHGLPLMGSGDWNDGMNLVGKDGRGESVWLAFFLYDVLQNFAVLARAHQDGAFADRCLTQAQCLQHNIEEHAWDGRWYRRAYDDDGEALGSQTNDECQIDSLPQSWAVISGAGERGRTRQAMLAVDQRLVHRQTGLIQLFDPPFDASSSNPGYIKGYIPGVRENGGQYTHAAIWSAMAFARLGDIERAWELFSLLNPIHHSSTPEQVAIYKAEPYVVAADVYALPPHIGRGGWSWYTGAAAWMYRLLVETLLGVNLEGDQLRLKPLLPAAWPSCKIHYRYRQTIYHISITRLSAETTDEPSLSLDGVLLVGDCVRLRDDSLEHEVEMLVR